MIPSFSSSSSQSISSLELLCEVATSTAAAGNTITTPTATTTSTTRNTPESIKDFSLPNTYLKDKSNKSPFSTISNENITSHSPTFSTRPCKPLPFPCSGYFETCFCFAFLQRFHSLLGWVFIPIEVFEDYICSLELNMSMNSKSYRWFRQWMLDLLDLIEPSSRRFSSLSWEKRLKSILPILTKSDHGLFFSQDDNTYETFSFLELGLKQKLQLLKALCEYALFSEPIQAHLKSTKDPSLLRLLPLGYDRLNQAYYAFDHCPRLYRSSSPSFNPSSSSSSCSLIAWDLLCVHLEDWEPLLSLCTNSIDSNEHDLGQALSRFHSEYLTWLNEQKVTIEPQNLAASQFVTHQPTQRILKRLGTTIADQSEFNQLSKTRFRSKVDPNPKVSSSSSKLKKKVKKHSKPSSLSTTPLSSKPHISKTRRVSKSLKPHKTQLSQPTTEVKSSPVSLLSNPTRSASPSSILSSTTSSSPSSSSYTYSSPSKASFLTSTISSSSSSPYSRSPSPFLSYADAFLPPPLVLQPRIPVAPLNFPSFPSGF